MIPLTLRVNPFELPSNAISVSGARSKLSAGKCENCSRMRFFLSPYIMTLSLPSLFEIILLRLQPYHRLPQLICFGFQLLSLQACWSKVCNIGHSVTRNRWSSSVTLNSPRFGFFSLFCLKYKIHHHKSYNLCALEIEITFEINWFYPQAETNFLLFLQLGFCLCHLLVPTCVHRGHLGIRSIVVSI